MYCKNCGYEMNENAVACVKCGTAKGKGNSYCPNCGKPANPGAAFCLNCGGSLNQKNSSYANEGGKSRLAAGLLGIFLGSLGIHNFYLGYTKKAVIQLLLCTVGSLLIVGLYVSAIWGLVEGIMIIAGKINVDAHGVPLRG